MVYIYVKYIYKIIEWLDKNKIDCKEIKIIFNVKEMGIIDIYLLGEWY